MRNSQRAKYRDGLHGIMFVMLLCVAGWVLLPSRVFAQQADEEKGIDQGNYNIKQAVEFGGRFTSVGGDTQTYDTMVNLQQGPRLLNFTTQMQSLDPKGTPFDQFYFSNFGYGGDPDVVSAIRISKHNWYSFNGMVRHDQNFWDYSLMANPFNPAAPPANAPVGFNPIVGAPATVAGTQVVAMTPHYYNTRRNLENFGVTILPESKIRFRVGFNHNTNSGPGYSTIHQGTEQLLFQNLSSTMDQYQFGIDFRFLPKTSISYDQVWSYYKTDPGQTDINQQFSPGTGFPPVDLGVSFNPGPCNPTFLAGGIVNPACSAYYSYSNFERTRFNAPTEQIRLTSNFISNVQITGKFSYTGGNLQNSQDQLGFGGRESRTALSNFTQGGPIMGRQVSSYGDLGVTWQITKDFSLVDAFHYGNWMQPAQFAASECSFFSGGLIAAPNVFTPNETLPVSTCAAPANGMAGIPAHSASSGPDVLLNIDANFLKQQSISNLIEGQVQLSEKSGAYFGYRYTHRVIADNFFNLQNAIYYPTNAERGSCAPTGGISPDGCTLNADGSVSYETPNPSYGPPGITTIDENAAVFGLWVRPTRNLRLNVDAEIGSANNTFTRLSPQNSQLVRARAQYKATTWLNLNAHFLTNDGQNVIQATNGSQHDRSTGASVSITPNEKLSAQLGYNYSNIYSDLFVCFTSSAALPGLTACPGVTGLVQETSKYTSQVNTGFLDVLWMPLRRLSVEVGANLSGVSGSQLDLNPTAPMPTGPLGALNSSWYQPYGSVSYRFAKRWTGRARYDYYGYHEDSNGSVQDVYAPRNFRANLVTLSVRYAL